MTEGGMERILGVDDSPLVRALLERVLGGRSRLRLAVDGESALSILSAAEFDLYLVDLMLPGMSGLALIDHIKQVDPAACIIVVSHTEDLDSVISVVRARVFDYLKKPLAADDLLQSVERATAHLRISRRLAALDRELSGAAADGLIFEGTSSAMRIMWRQARLFAESGDRETVLVTGESGTGKELVARAIHRWSVRRDRPFISVNCSLLGGELASAELFGVGRRVATGVESYGGKFEAADTGTLFLDEVGELPGESQTMLLRVLQDGAVCRIGSSHERIVDVRVLAATNRPLEEALRDGGFRQDLYYRLNVLRLRVPPLRERREDIPGLVGHLLARHSRRLHLRSAPRLEPEWLRQLTDYNWPGNVRQLENVLIRMLVTGELSMRHEPAIMPLNGGDSVCVQDRTFQDLEREIFSKVLARHDWNVARAAAQLNIGRSSLYEKMKRYELSR
ncbi:sigma-54-dependent Fis family transcriptional regulator [bacterium]|nr:sigma-54-dependent Fis family transcriptional regulator [candidate division CSSED10-310 bacterium]